MRSTSFCYRDALLVFVLSLLLYARTLGGDFVFDDRSAIRDNPIVHRGDPAEIFSTDYWAGFHRDRSGLYRPLAVLSFALSYRLAGAHPFSYHLVEIALHAGVALLLYVFCLRLLRRRLALWSALLFAAHPVQSEAVCALVGRADLLAALFGLAALCLHLRRGLRPHLAAGAFLLAALLSKESAIVVPALALLADLFQYRAFRGKGYRRFENWPYLLLYAGLVLAYLAWRDHVLGGLGPGTIDRLDNPLIVLSPALRLLNAFLVLGRYFGLLLLPGPLAADYSFAALSLARGFWSPEAALALSAFCAMAFLLVHSWRRLPRAAFGLSWLLIALAPVSNIFLPIGTIMAERLLYLPAAGFAIFLAAALAAPRPGAGRRGLLIVLLLFYGARTFVRTGDWQSDYTLFSQAVRTCPGSARAWKALGEAALERGEKDRALAAFGRALEILPDYYEVYNELGVFYLGEKAYGRARKNFGHALLLKRNYPPAWLNLALVHYHLGQQYLAIDALRRAAACDPNYARAYYNLGVIYLEEGALALAAALFEKSLSLDPAQEAARFNLEAVARLRRR